MTVRVVAAAYCQDFERFDCWRNDFFMVLSSLVNML